MLKNIYVNFYVQKNYVRATIGQHTKHLPLFPNFFFFFKILHPLIFSHYFFIIVVTQTHTKHTPTHPFLSYVSV